MLPLMIILAARGYDHEAHYEAVLEGDEDEIALTHPSNFLREEEIENLQTYRLFLQWYRANYLEATS